MKKAIHPQWNHQANVVCACGNTFQTGSGQDEIRVDICSTCHPFYTGSMKFVDVQGRVDRFTKMRDAAAAHKATSTKKKEQVAKAPQRSLKDLLEEEKKRLKTA